MHLSPLRSRCPQLRRKAPSLLQRRLGHAAFIFTTPLKKKKVYFTLEERKTGCKGTTAQHPPVAMETPPPDPACALSKFTGPPSRRDASQEELCFVPGLPGPRGGTRNIRWKTEKLDFSSKLTAPLRHLFSPLSLLRHWLQPERHQV